MPAAASQWAGHSLTSENSRTSLYEVPEARSRSWILRCSPSSVRFARPPYPRVNSPSSICSAKTSTRSVTLAYSSTIDSGWENTAPPGPHSLPSSIDHWLSPLRAIGNSSGGPKRG